MRGDSPQASGVASSLVRALVVDGERRIVESEVRALSVGAVIDASSWIGSTLVDAIDAALQTRQTQSRVGRDDAHATHWIVQADAPSSDPIRVRLTVVDATMAVDADRLAVLGKLVHSMQNRCFALQSVVDAIAEDRPQGDHLDEYLAHLREPTERISKAMSRLNAFLLPPLLSRVTMHVDALIEHAMGLLPIERRPKMVDVRGGRMTLSCDIALLSDAVTAMVEAHGEDASPTVDVERVDIDAKPHVRVVIERRALVPEDRSEAGLWDLAGGHRFEMALRFSLARAVVLAHGGEVFVRGAAKGRSRLGFHLPLLSGE